jgi:hypothetical protein
VNRRRALAALTVTAALILSGAACSASGEVDGDYGSSSDVADCDANDRRKKEIPDCGRKVNGTYREWSWVAAGKTKPPAGWKASKEAAPAVDRPAPKATQAKKSTTTGGGTKSGTSRSGTSGRRR